MTHTFDLSTPWQIQRKRLRARGWTKVELDDYKRQRDAYKKERRDMEAQVKVFKRTQRQILAPLRAEIRIATSQSYYWTPQRSQEHHEFYLKYKTVLLEVQTALIGLFNLRGELPTTIAQELGIPYRGTHWTDWVDWCGEQQFPPINDLKAKIQRKYAELTFKAGRKRKAIMTRWTPDTHREAVDALLKRTKGELESLERIQQVAHDVENATLINKIKRALELIPKLTLEQDVPRTWHGLFKE